MEKTIGQNNATYGLFTVADSVSGTAIPVRKKRVLVGRSQACDIVIPFTDVTAIHAVIEIGTNEFTIYDMNSRNGTFVNDKKVVFQSFSQNDTIRFASREFVLKKIEANDIPPAPLSMLDAPLPPIMPEEQKTLPETPPSDLKEQLPRVEYPLAKDPRAEFSEYIFEDVEELYPVFHYNPQLDAVEVIILFKDTIFSVDYLPVKNGTYYLTGSHDPKKDVSYAYWKKNERVPFVTITGGEIFVESLPGHDYFTVDKPEQKQTSSSMCLGHEDIIRLVRGDVQIFVRRTESPPKVDRAPILRRDQGFKRYLVFILLFFAIFMGAMRFIEVDKEKEEEKLPERVATILYKKKIVVSKYKAVTKTKKAPKKVAQKSPQKKEPQKPKPKPTPKPKVKPTPKPKVKKIAKAAPKRPTKKVAPNKGPTNRRRKKVTPTRKKTVSAAKRGGAKRVSKTVTKKKGPVDTYKSFDFKSTVSSVLSKGGALKKVNVAQATYGSGSSGGKVSGAEQGATAKSARVSKNIGSLKGASSGRLDSGEGLQGVGSKSVTYAAGIPYETVVLGGMDPDVIRRILKEHIPQFRYCYQKELDKSNSAISGKIYLKFVIGSSGHVTKAGVTSKSSLPASVKGCVVNVLRGIEFPAPEGGGTADISQPMNFYPKKR